MDRDSIRGGIKMSDYNCDLCGTYVDSYQLEKWLHSSDKVLCKKCEKEEKIRRKIDERFTKGEILV